MAARVVACENIVLRNLVREITGCNEQQLRSYLPSTLRPVSEQPGETRAMGHHCARIESSPSIPLPAGQKESRLAESRLEPDPPQRPNPTSSAGPNPQPPPYIGSDPRCHGGRTLHIPSDKNLADLDGNQSTPAGQDVTDLESNRSFDSGPAPVDGNQSSDFDRQQGPSMSCEEAAAIISNISIMDGSRDIREQLGCTSGGTCSVNNIEVFQVLGEAL